MAHEDEKKRGRRRRHRRPRSQAAERLAPRLELGAEAAAVLALLAAPLMIASVPTWAVWVALGLAAASLSGVLASAQLRGRSLPVPGLAWVFAGAVAVEAVQLVPLPPWLLGLVSPRARELYAFVLSDLHAWPAWRTLSLDPVQTGLEVARHVTVLALFLALVALGEDRRRRRRLATALVLTAVAVVVLAFVQRLLGLDRIYGVWPTRPQGWLFAAFVNPNHFGAYLDLLAPAALGLALSSRDRSKTVLWGLAFVLLAGAAFLTLSRGGIVALLAGVTVFAALRRRAPEAADERPEGVPPPPARGRLRRVVAPLLVGGALSVAAYLALDPITKELSTLTSAQQLEDESRWTIWGETLPLVRDFWLTGIGRGAYAVTFPIYEHAPADRTFYYSENQPLEALAELGVPAGLALLGLLAFAWVGAARRPGLSAREAGLLAGLAALALHELADFATFFGGVALPAAAAFALLAHGSKRRLPAGRLALGLAPLLALGVLLLARGTGTTADEDLAALQARLASGAGVDAAVRPVVVRRPTDHMPALVAAERLLRAAPRSADPRAALERALWWVTRAMYLSPTETRGHLLAADILALAGHDAQARLEYRLAVEMGEPPARVIALAAARWQGAAELRASVPDDVPSQLALARWLSAQKRHEDAFALLSELRARAPGDPDVLAALAGSALALGRADDAAPLAESLTEAVPSDPRGWLLAAQAKTAGGDLDGAERALRAGLGRAPGDPAVALALAAFLNDRRKDPKAALSVLAAMRLPDGAGARARMHMLEGRVRLSLGKTRRALDSFRTAARLDPDTPWPLVAIGDAYLAGQQYERALDAYEAAGRTRGGRASPVVAARIERARKQVEALETFRKRRAIYGTDAVALPVPE